METVFLFCFVFGALFTVVSAVLGFTGSVLTHLPGGPVHAGEGHDLPSGHATHADGHPAHHPLASIGQHDLAQSGEHVDQPSVSQFFSHVPLLNVSSLLAFLTAFGATGFILMHFSGWSAILATPVAVVPGVLAGVLIALLIGKILAGETVMRPIDYELEGTLGRVTVSIPAGGVGEVVFSKRGSRRSEAARSLGAKAIPYNTEVVIVEYEHGTALVEPYAEFVNHYERELPLPNDPASAGDTQHERNGTP